MGGGGVKCITAKWLASGGDRGRWIILRQESRQSNSFEFPHRGPTQAASLVVCLSYKEMYGRILKSLIS